MTEKLFRITIRNENIPKPPNAVISFTPCRLVQYSVAVNCDVTCNLAT